MRHGINGIAWLGDSGSLTIHQSPRKQNTRVAIHHGSRSNVYADARRRCLYATGVPNRRRDAQNCRQGIPPARRGALRQTAPGRSENTWHERPGKPRDRLPRGWQDSVKSVRQMVLTRCGDGDLPNPVGRCLRTLPALRKQAAGSARKERIGESRIPRQALTRDRYRRLCRAYLYGVAIQCTVAGVHL